MKTRNGFVSNSSSSSYIVFASNNIELEQIEKEDIDKGLVYCHGRDLGEGFDFFQVTLPIYKFLFDRNIQYDNRISDMSFKKIYYHQDSETSGLFTKKMIMAILNDIPEDVSFSVESIETSYHSSSSVKEVRDRYFEDIELDDEEILARQYLDLEKRRDEQDKVAAEISKEMKDMSKKVNLNMVKKLRG